jgi:branched-chain amino acid transport system ATP-binding protein
MPTSPDDGASNGRGDGREEGLVGPALDVSSLSAGYGTVPVVVDIDVQVRLGEIVAILGPNGAGKSTLLKALTGRLRPSAGTVTLNGEDITGLSGDRLARKGLGYVPQTRDVFETLTVSENLEMGGYLLTRRRVPTEVERVLAQLPMLRPLMDRTVRSLSGGERKLLAIARSLMLEPRVLLLDEPTASLAPVTARAVLHTHVRKLAGAGTAILLVEQRVHDALEVADRAHVMVGGHVRVSAPAAELLEREDVGEMFLGVVR